MKLKQKLANEYIAAFNSNYTDDGKKLLSADFIAGFDAAKRLILQLSPFGRLNNIERIGEDECESYEK
jgi:hypothetical protein